MFAIDQVVAFLNNIVDTDDASYRLKEVRELQHFAGLEMLYNWIYSRLLLLVIMESGESTIWKELVTSALYIKSVSIALFSSNCI